ncbi:CIR protein, partial [Plasmodium chabaudi adami]
KGLEININYDKSLKSYCPILNYVNNQECTYYEQVVASAFIALLTLFKKFDDDEDEDVLEDDKLAEYAILWLCYKIDQGTYKYSNLSAFYKKYIMDNEKNIKEENGANAYKSYKDIINNIICSKTIDISNMSKFYEGFELLSINEIDKLFSVETKGSETNINYDKSLNAYCPILNYVNNQECTYYEQVVASAFIALLTLFNNLDNDDEDVLENNKLAEYAILWLCYKIDQGTYKYSNLSAFYKKYIMDNEKNIKEENGANAYKSYKDIINNIICSKTIDISNMSKFYEGFELLCKMYYECNGSSKDCTACLEKAKEFSEHFEKLNRNSDITEDDPYYKVLCTLSNDYEKLKNKYDNAESSKFPSLPPIKPTKSSTRNTVEASVQLS